MNKKNLLLALATAMMMGGCVSKSDESVPAEKQPGGKSITDTMLVIGVWNQPGAFSWIPMKTIVLENKTGDRYTYNLNAYDKHNKLHNVLPYIERGDTVCVKNGEIVKNLTMERMAERYVNGR